MVLLGLCETVHNQTEAAFLSALQSPHYTPKADSNPAGLISICRADTDLHHNSCGTALIF